MAGATPGHWSIALADEAATARLAEDVACILRPGDVVRLSGDLGAGKTSFARALIRSLAGDPLHEVPSPTFPLRIDYAFPRLALSHLDLYRIGEADELEELGIDEAVGSGALLVEWPDLLPARLGTAELAISLAIEGSGRRAIVAADAGFAPRLERSLAARRFLDGGGRAGASRIPIIGDASARAYERIVSPAGSEILMNAPARPEAPPARGGRSYDEVAHRARDVRPFVAIGALLESRGVRVPRLAAADTGLGLLLLEDLGRDLVVDDAGRAIPERYAAAIDLLAAMHRAPWPRVAEAPGIRWPIPPYDRDALLIEISLFPDWIGGFPARERAPFLAAWDAVLDAADLRTDTLVMRDFHSPNILWQAGAAGHARVGVLDYQDALLGDPAYDVASLAQDARVPIAEDEEERLLARYVAARRAADSGFDDARFRRAYRVLAAQRATKVMGAFHRLAVAEGKTGYRRHLDHVASLIRRNLADPVLSGLRLWYEPYLA